MYIHTVHLNYNNATVIVFLGNEKKLITKEHMVPHAHSSFTQAIKFYHSRAKVILGCNLLIYEPVFF